MTEPSNPIKERRALREITQLFTGWMKREETRFRAMESSNSNPETWAQVSFAVEVKLHHGIDVETPLQLHTQQVYAQNPLKAAALVIDSGNDGKGWIIELKIESKSAEGMEFARMVVEDQRNVSGGLKDEYKDYDVFVLAVAWKETTRRALRDVHMDIVPGSEIQMKTKNQQIMLFEWNGEVFEPPAKAAA